MKPPFTLLVALIMSILAISTAESAQPAHPSRLLAFVGTYTGGGSQGIYAYRFDPRSGKVEELGLAAKTINPTFLALHPSGRFLYAVNELGQFQGKRTGAVSAFAIDAAHGKLTFLNQVASGGGGPCHLLVDRTGRFLFVANYGGGSVAMLPIHSDGRLGEAMAFFQHRGSSVSPQRQEGPHAHEVALSPDQRFLFVPDLGLDRILIYRYDAAAGTLRPNDPAFVATTPGGGPRHIVFFPGSEYACSINELGSSLTVFAYDAARGSLRNLRSYSTLPPDFTGPNGAAELALHQNGRFLYASNRGNDSIAVFAVDAHHGELKLVERVPSGGKTPRHFALDPSGRWLWAENRNSNAISLFRVDPQSGRLTATGRTLSVVAPVCVQFLRVE